MKMRVAERRAVVGTEADKRDEVEVLKDETVRPKRKSTAAKYAADDGLLRRVTARVVVQGKWKLSFSRLAGIVRCAVWVRRSLTYYELTLDSCGGVSEVLIYCNVKLP